MSGSALLLRTAVEILDEGGWCQKVAVDGEGRRCAKAALHDSMSRLQGSTDTAGFVKAIRDLTKRIEPYTIPIRNDHPGRTQAQVMALFEAAAADFEARDG